MFICRECRRSLDISEARKGVPLSVDNIGHCKRCHSIHAKNYMMNRKAIASPDNYMDCDDCDRTFCKRAPNKVLRDKCPFCDSNNIGEYV